MKPLNYVYVESNSVPEDLKYIGPGGCNTVWPNEGCGNTWDQTVVPYEPFPLYPQPYNPQPYIDQLQLLGVTAPKTPAEELLEVLNKFGTEEDNEALITWLKERLSEIFGR